jgi:serine/threonine protein kinase
VTDNLAHLEGTYEVLGKLKEGGMGAVFKVRHRLLGELRVVKVMRPQLAHDPGFAERFSREARAAIRLRHPNIAQLFDFTLDEQGNAYMVLEFVDGLDLKEVLRRHGPLPVGLTLEVARQALAAVGFLHRRGMVHRDISPDNLMLSRDEDAQPVVKLIDLGIVKVLDAEASMTSTGMFLGKVRYASPEQFRSTEGGRIDQRSDLYSVGVVLYELLTGTFPITGDTSSAIMAGHLYRPPVGFEVSDPQGRVPTAVRRTVLRLLEKDPALRFPSAEELAEVLSTLQHDYPWSQEELDRCLPPPPPQVQPTPAPPPAAKRATSSAPKRQEVVPTAPTLVLSAQRAAAERAAELEAAFDRCLERGEVAEATALLAQAREAGAEGEPIQRMEQRLAQHAQPTPSAPPRRGIGPAVLGAAIVATLLVVAGGTYLGLRTLRAPSEPRGLDTSVSPGAALGPATPAAGRLVIHALPWAEVVAVRTASGSTVPLPDNPVTPLVLNVPAGDYTVLLRHPQVAEDRTATVRVEAGKTATVTVEAVAQSVDSFLAKMGW